MIAVAAVTLLAALDYHPETEGIKQCAFREIRKAGVVGARSS